MPPKEERNCMIDSRGAGEDALPGDGFVLFPVACGRSGGVFRLGELRTILCHGHDVTRKRALHGVVLEMKSLLECALDNWPHLIVGVWRGTGSVRRVGLQTRRLERGDTRDDVEVVEVDPGRAGEDGAVLAVIGEGDQIENGGVAHIEALMAEI